MLKSNKINPNQIANTEQLVKKMLKVPDSKSNDKALPHAPADEDALMESLDNLDMLLANIGDKGRRDDALKKLSDNFGIKPPVPKPNAPSGYQQPF